MPSVSVIIPVYNAELFLAETINSVLCQTFEDFELLLMDDGSEDKSPEIIQSFSDRRIIYARCEHDFIGTVNTGLQSAKGKYIAQLDHDDLMTPERLQVQYDFMRHNPHIAACGGYMYTFGDYSIEMKVPLDHHSLIENMIIGSPMLNPTGFIRKDFLEANQIKYERGYSFAADFKFWSDIAKAGEIANVPKVLTKYRVYEKQTSRIYRKASTDASHLIQYEMVEYFLSHLQFESALGELVRNQFLPSVQCFLDNGFFSPYVYFSFMYEIIKGLREKKVIKK